METVDVDSISMKLDHLVVEYFSTLDEILKQQRELEMYMRDGFLYMSNARKSMGFRRLSAAQYDLGMQADFCVDVEKEKKIVKFKKYDCVKENEDEKENQEEKGSLRMRKSNINAEDSGVEEITESVQKLDVQGSGENGFAKKNPIHMFGVLVPKALKESQARFKRALELTVSLSSLKAKLLCLKSEYQECHEHKRKSVEANKGAPVDTSNCVPPSDEGCVETENILPE